ncbi:Kazal [Gracilaria domingensis]|nr:Kazal [Gracilaria domingensis]
MDTPTRYESIPRTPGGPISGAPVGNRSWSARVAARLPHRTSVRSLLILSIAVVAVLGVSYFRRAPEYYRSLSWPDFSVQRFARIGYGYSKVDSLKASIAPDTLSFLSRGGGRGGGRCFRKCGKLPGPKVCCAHDGGEVLLRIAAIVRARKRPGKRKCCKCKPEGKVLSRGECPTEAPSSGLCDCPKVYEPVCCDTEDGRSYTAYAGSPTPAPPTPAPPTPAPPTPAPPTPAPGPPESCPRIYEPFCCRTIYGRETAPNRCECLRVGAFPLYDGACNKETCPCPSINAPVCCDTEDGPKTAFNECECRCDPQNDVISSGECGAVSEPPSGSASACDEAYDLCDFAFAGEDEDESPVYSVDGPPDIPFTPVIVSKDPNERLGVLNTNNIEVEIIEDDGSYVGITSLPAQQTFSPTQFKPLTVPNTKMSGIGHQTFQTDQKEVIRGRCVRIFFTHYQLLEQTEPFNVIDNVSAERGDNKCVVFETE